MSALDASQADQLEELDRRRHQRVKVNLLGRCMFADRREFPCQILNISPGGAEVLSPIKGEITRHIEGGFAMTIVASSRKRDKLADTLTWLANRHVLNLPEDRRHARRPVGRGVRLAKTGISRLRTGEAGSLDSGPCRSC